MTSKTSELIQRILYVVLLLGTALVLISPFLIPIILAATIALSLYPLQKRLEKRNWKKQNAAALLTGAFTLIIFIPFLTFLAEGTVMVTEQLHKFSFNERIKNQGMQKLIDGLKVEIVATIQKYLTKFKVASFLTEDRIEHYLQSVNVFLIDFFQSFATNLPMVFLFFIVMILCTFSLLSNAKGVRQFFQRLFGFSDEKMDLLSDIYIRNSRQVYLSNIITGAIQALIVSIGAFFIVDADWFLVFFLTLIASFIPVIGAAPITLIFAFVAFVQGNTTGAIVLGVLGLFTGVIDNILRPWLASLGESNEPPIVSFICVLGGALLLGFPGLFIGLLIGSITYDTLPLFWEGISSQKE